MQHHFLKTNYAADMLAYPVLIYHRTWYQDEDEIEAAAIFSHSYLVSVHILLSVSQLPPLIKC